MPFFEYKAITKSGSQVIDVMEASDTEAVADRLQNLGYLPINIRSKNQTRHIQVLSKSKKLKSAEIIVFTKQLVTLLKAGVPLLSSLKALIEQSENETLKNIIQTIYVDIESGMSFSDALNKHPKIFSEIYVNSIKAGEMGGTLDEVLERLSQLMEHEQDTKARIKAAMRYPMIVIVSLVMAFITLMLLVVPNFIDLFEKLGVDLPLPTRILIGVYSAITNYWYIIIAVIVVIMIAFLKYIKTEKGAFNWDYFKINTPVFGTLNLKTAMSRFTRMFETLNSSGLPILQTLEISAKTVGNVVVGKEIEKAAYGVLQGEGIAGPLSQGKIFPPMVVRMIAIGEQSGSLDDMLINISKHYDTEVDYAVKKLTAMIEPILTVSVGVIVLFLALAIFLPMWDLNKLAH
ncbi:MAG: type II secretion system F family protein [bacterium]